jgi:phasin family protein
MNKAQETVELMNDLGSKGYDSLRQLGELQMATWNKLMEKQMTAFNTVVDTAVAQVQLASEAKDYAEALRSQADLTRKLAEDLVGQTRESVELVQGVSEEYRAWAEAAVKQASEEAGKVVEQAA